MNFKDAFLLLLAIGLSLLIGYLGLQTFAPRLLGAPADLKLVQVEERSPAFYENVFHAVEPAQLGELINDPFTTIRAQPFFPETLSWGPNDLLGFRNRSIPASVDLLIIGDSQTYGNNVFLQDNWPEQLREQYRLSGKTPSIYSMATGGWGATQYLNMMQYAVQFKPELVIVAFYTGNDPLDSFMAAYGNQKWSQLRAGGLLSVDDVPDPVSLADTGDHWQVDFPDGVSTVFTPSLRNTSNMPHPAVDAGYMVMEKSAAQIAEIARQNQIKPLFTVIPTKEFVYAEKLVIEKIQLDEAYKNLVENEQNRIKQFTSFLKTIDGAGYIDVIGPLRQAAKKDRALYPPDVNGHPVEEGYSIIAKAVFDGLQAKVPGGHISDGLLQVKFPDGSFLLAIKKKNTIRYAMSPVLLVENGWQFPEELEVISVDQITQFEVLPTIREVNPALFGPESSEAAL